MTERPVVRKLDPAGAGRELHAALAGDPGFTRHTNPSAAWSFRGAGVVVSLYSTGKLVVQGPGAAAFAEERLGGAPPTEPEEPETLDEDLVGTDESGKGDYFGPLVVAAVLAPKGQESVLREIGARDCKLVSDEAAREAARLIRAGYEHEVVVIPPPRYNELYSDFGNLNRLLAWATAKAIEGVLSRRPCRRVLSDKFGDERLIEDALRKKGIDVDLTQRVRAEANPAVAAASILARDAFLRELARLGKETGRRLPKGAGPPVEVAARLLFREGGREALEKVAKMHFKTTARITGELF